jgi:TPP-dependent pyruvate/acetoin dehydrogenase alpha subunit
MTDKKDGKADLTSDIMMADIMLRVTAMEKCLIDKGVLTQTELAAANDEIAKKVAKVVLERAQASKNLEGFVADLENSSKENKDFKN